MIIPLIIVNGNFISIPLSKCVLADETYRYCFDMVSKNRIVYIGAEISRFTMKAGIPSTRGEAITLRVKKQASYRRKTHPYGAYHLNKDKIKCKDLQL